MVFLYFLVCCYFECVYIVIVLVLRRLSEFGSISTIHESFDFNS